jgi:hypothetical protein
MASSETGYSLPSQEVQQVFKASMSSREVIMGREASDPMRSFFERQWNQIEEEEAYSETGEIELPANWNEVLGQETSWVETNEARKRQAKETAKDYRVLIKMDTVPGFKDDPEEQETIQAAKEKIQKVRAARGESFPQHVVIGFRYLIEEELGQNQKTSESESDKGTVENSHQRQEIRRIFKSILPFKHIVKNADPKTNEGRDLRKWALQNWDNLAVEEVVGEMVETPDEWNNKLQTEGQWIDEDPTTRLPFMLSVARAYQLVSAAKDDPTIAKRRSGDLNTAKDTIAKARESRNDNFEQFIQLGLTRLFMDELKLADSITLDVGASEEEWVPTGDTEITLQFLDGLRQNQLKPEVWQKLINEIERRKNLGKTFVGFDKFLAGLGVDISELDSEALWRANPFDISRTLQRRR